MRPSGDERARSLLITWGPKEATQTGAEKEGDDQFWAMGQPFNTTSHAHMGMHEAIMRRSA